MGDRISIQFENGEEQSVVLFNHWGGKEFADVAMDYAIQLNEDIKTGKIAQYTPLGRLEPQTVMVDFVRYITDGKLRVETSLYFGATENDGDNSDNGHIIIDLVDLKILGGK